MKKTLLLALALAAACADAAPAYYRQQIGDLRVTALFDGTLPLPLAAKAENANGHTIGHSAFRFNNGQGAALLVWGDLVHFPAIQFARPDASYSFDYDAAAGIASRQRLMQEAAEQHLTVAGAHLPFPGIGRVNKDNDGRAYRWRPVEYTPQ